MKFGISATRCACSCYHIPYTRVALPMLFGYTQSWCGCVSCKLFMVLPNPLPAYVRYTCTYVFEDSSGGKWTEMVCAALFSENTKHKRPSFPKHVHSRHGTGPRACVKGQRALMSTLSTFHVDLHIIVNVDHSYRSFASCDSQHILLRSYLHDIHT